MIKDIALDVLRLFMLVVAVAFVHVSLGPDSFFGSGLIVGAAGMIFIIMGK